MTENLQKWIEENKMIVSESKIDGLDTIIIDGFGTFLFIHPNEEGKIIDGDFSFILSDEEFEVLDDKKVNFILFEFGGKFYYSGIKQTKNKYNELVYQPEFNDFKYLGTCSEEFVLDFANLGVHDEYEMLSGSGSCELWCKKAKFLGHKAIGVCDKNSLASSLSFQTAAEKFGLKSIIGETVSVAINYNPEEQIQETFELKLYVLNQKGWNNLLLISKSINVDYSGFIPSEELYKRGEGICCVIPKASEFNHLLSNGDKKGAVRLLSKYKKSFDKVYYQIDTVEYESKQLFREHLRNIDNYLMYFRKSIKPILINDSYYLDAEEHALKGLLHKISGKAAPEAKDQYFKSVSETIDSYKEWIDDVEPLFEAIVSGIENTVKLCDSVDFKINSGERKLPKFEVDDPEDLFFNELQKGFNERLGHKSKKELKVYEERLEKECAVIVPNGLCDYFLILWDIKRWCKEKNIATGPGRGSVCGSLIAYLLYITDIDPIPYSLLFERFLNETRVSGERAKSADSMPDIDCDFETEYRDTVKEYIKDKYGKDYSCSVGTCTRMKLKTCIKDFAKVKGLSFDYTNKITKDIDDQIEYTWSDLFEYATKSKTLFKFVQDYPEIVHMTKYSLLSCKAASVHPSAVIIVPKEDSHGNKQNVFTWMPIKMIDGILVSEWEGKYVDKSGFLKEDILGLNQLDKLKNMLSLVKQNKGEDIDLNNISFDDQEVFRYFKKGWNEDVFQFGTMGLMNYCKQVKPENLEDLIAMTALFRPAIMEIGGHQDFADIKRGRKKPKYDLGMDKITEATLGIYVYQEQVMQAAVVGGLSPIESDIMRTAIKKKKMDVLNSFRDKFVDGYSKLLKNNGVSNPNDKAEEVWNKLLSFAGYGFNRSHAAAYTVLSYWSQWFKVNYPLEFWTTSLQYAKESDIPYRLSEMKKIGVNIEIRQPDINYSKSNFTCDSENNRIFYSLNKIKGIGEVAVKAIVETRDAGGQFFSLEEFLSRVPSKVNKTVVKCLIVAGAFDLLEDLQQPRDRRDLLEKYLIDKKGDKELPKEYNTEEAKISNSFWILEQKRLTGFGEIDYESMLPNKRMRNIYVNESDFAISRDETEVCIAGKLLSYTEREIKTGVMCSIQIDSNNTIISCTIWPDAYERVLRDVDNNMLDVKGKVICISGNVRKDKFRNQKMLFSNQGTRMYIIS